MTWQEKCAKILSATITKRLKQQQNVYLDEGPMDKEYLELEQIGPAPGNPCMQHDAMVEQGLCKAAVANSTSNRYCNLFPYDSHRVILETRDPTESDYINASWVNVEGVSDKFVLTMAPLIAYSPSRNTNSDNGGSTCSSFWRMVDQTGTRTIVMMCTIERGFQGCSQYFPPEVETHQDHGEYRVTLQAEYRTER
jgi:protein tyrosine phosphatase